MQDKILPFVSSIFVRRLLLPGVLHNAALYATLVEYNRHLGESELQTLTADGLKKEILSLIEHEVFVVISVQPPSLSLTSSCVSPCKLTRFFNVIGWL